MIVNEIGKTISEYGAYVIQLAKKYANGLKGLKGFSNVKVIWWFDGSDNERDRTTLIENKRYKKGPNEMGVFALRSPERPNPIAVSNCYVLEIDENNGIIKVPYIDASVGSPVLDIKPFTASIDKVDSALVPDWCKHCPKSYEESADFDW